jgi:hypothetical protein
MLVTHYGGSLLLRACQRHYLGLSAIIRGIIPPTVRGNARETVADIASARTTWLKKHFNHD